MIELLLCFTFITHDLFNDFLKDGYYTIRLVLYLTKQSSFDLRQKIRVSTKNKSVDKNKSFTGGSYVILIKFTREKTKGVFGGTWNMPKNT